MTEKHPGSSPERIRILLASGREDVLPRSIGEALSTEPDLTVTGPVPLARLGAALAAGPRPHVLLLVEDGARSPEVRRVLQEQGGIVLLRIGIEGGDLTMRLEQPGLAKLVAIIRTVATDLLPPLKAPALVAEADDEAAYDNPRQHLRDALDWLDAALLTFLATEQASGRRGQEGDMPALTLGVTTVEALLGSDTSGPRENGVRSAALAVRADALLRRMEARLARSAPDAVPFRRLAERLGLKAWERLALIACLAPDLDPKYQRIFGFLHDDLSRRRASQGLLQQVLAPEEDPVALAGVMAGLARWRLIEPLPAAADELLHADPAVQAFLLGDAHALETDPRIAAALQPAATGLAPARALHPGLVATLSAALAGQVSVWHVLSGPSVADAPAIAEAAAADASRRLLRIDAARAAAVERDDAALLLIRATAISGAVPVFDMRAGAAEGRSLLAALLATADPGLVFVAEPTVVATLAFRRPPRLLHLPEPNHATRARAWRAAAEAQGLPLGPATQPGEKPSEDDPAERLAASFRLPAAAMEAAGALALAAWGEATPQSPMEALQAASRRVAAGGRLPSLARRIEPAFGLDAVVLPPDQRRQLDAIVRQVRHAGTVMEEWGFAQAVPYGRGIAALFTGPSGTGKTMAAQGIAQALGADLYAVDLARVVSKYIGETEKNLDTIFAEAEAAQAVLLFDEADALFGRRGEVKDAHDRYANLEVAYLLQRMEAFGGLAILTTNLRHNLDPAFLRRLRFVVEFPQPEAALRERIWLGAFPPGTKLAEGLDWRFLARRLELSGGNIRSITLNAAFAAAAEGMPVGLRHIVEATRGELLKLGMPASERDLAARLPLAAGGSRR